MIRDHDHTLTVVRAFLHRQDRFPCAFKTLREILLKHELFRCEEGREFRVESVPVLRENGSYDEPINFDLPLHDVHQILL